MFGEGEFSGGKANGNRISVIAKTEFQGQEVELGIKGNVEGDSIEGTISTSLMPMELEFFGQAAIKTKHIKAKKEGNSAKSLCS